MYERDAIIPSADFVQQATEKLLRHTGSPMAHRSWPTDKYPAGCSKRPSSKAAASEEVEGVRFGTLNL